MTRFTGVVGSALVCAAVLCAVGCGGRQTRRAPRLAVSERATIAKVTSPSYVCHPELIDWWAPRWVPPAQPTPGACTVAQIEEHYAACDGSGASKEACENLKVPANKICLQCLLSESWDVPYAAVIFDRHEQFSQANQPGCIALVDGDTSATGCGAKRQLALSCIEASCARTCSINRSRMAWETCQQEASLTQCQKYVEAASCYKPEYAKCFHASFKDYFVETAKQFCVSGL